MTVTLLKAGITAGGLVVHATDTGRVLMLQRSLEDESPHAGMWEFPGGKLEEGESPEAGALREWAEETGLAVPRGTVRAAWDSGVYRGHVLSIPREEDLDILEGRADGANPDDPDGDQVETLAWWDPGHLEGNPAVRPELAADWPRLMAALGPAAKVGPHGYEHSGEDVEWRQPGISPVEKAAWEHEARGPQGRWVRLGSGRTGPELPNAPRKDQRYWSERLDRELNGEGIYSLPNTAGVRNAIGNKLDRQGLPLDSPLRGVLQYGVRGSHKLIHRDAGGKIDAGVDYFYDKKLRTSTHHISINDIRVLPQRRGIGTAMIRDLARRHPEATSMAVYGAVAPARPWYEKTGAEFVPWSSMGEWGPGALAALRSAEKSQKSEGGSRWPGWKFDLELGKHYARLIDDAFQSAMAKVGELLREWWAGRIGDTLQGFASQVRHVIERAIGPVLRNLWREAWYLGAHSARILSGVSGPDWGDWKPGDPEAAREVETAAQLQELLETHGVRTIKSIASSRMQALADMIAQAVRDGDSADTLARKLPQILRVPSRANMIAQTEIARAVSAASLAQYRNQGVTKKRWMIAPDERVCPVCHLNEEAGAVEREALFPSGDPNPPAHPHCRCAVEPAEIYGVELAASPDLVKRWFHVSPRVFSPGEQVVCPSARGAFPAHPFASDLRYNYLTSDPTSAWKYATSGQLGSQPHRIYEVAPTGWLETDPQPGELDGAFRTQSSLIVLREVPAGELGRGNVPGITEKRFNPLELRDPEGKWTTESYEGEVGNRNHITQVERGLIPTSAIASLQGAAGEKPGEHRNRQGADWDSFKEDIAANGVKEPLFITVDHGKAPVISEGNHRRDAAVDLGLPRVPVEIKYYGHAEQEGSVSDRAGEPVKGSGPLDYGDMLDREIEYSGQTGRGGDNALDELARKAGFDAPPDVVTDEELDARIASGEKEFWRGVHARTPEDRDNVQKYSEQLMHGNYRAGNGVYGNGIYVASKQNSAESYASGRGSLARMSLDASAKVAKFEELLPQMFKAFAEIDGTTERGAREAKLLADAGRWAVIQGWDAIDPGDGSMVILNRGKLHVSSQLRDAP